MIQSPYVLSKDCLTLEKEEILSLSCAHGVTSQVVENLMDLYCFTDRTITSDSNCTILQLTLYILSEGLIIVGTVKKNIYSTRIFAK